MNKPDACSGCQISDAAKVFMDKPVLCIKVDCHRMLTCFCVDLQAKNEPAGKKPADKSDPKKAAAERRHSTDSK